MEEKSQEAEKLRRGGKRDQGTPRAFLGAAADFAASVVPGLALRERVRSWDDPRWKIRDAPIIERMLLCEDGWVDVKADLMDLRWGAVMLTLVE
jgi:hypothetical protein